MELGFSDEKKYSDLHLAKIRDAAGLDFAHFTYQNGMCSCCYFPTDLPALYWAGKSMAEKKERREKARESHQYTYILFKNAHNGSGIVKRNNTICRDTHRWHPGYRNVYIEWDMNDEQLETVCRLLQEQLGSGYQVTKPEDIYTCIEISYVGEGTK